MTRPNRPNQPVSIASQGIEPRTLPTGTVTFLFTDIEGSTKLAQSYPEAMFALLAQHHEILNQAITIHKGYIFQIVGDSFSAAFHHASDALLAALDIQRALIKQDWSPAAIRVRVGIHTGAADLQAASNDQRYSGYATIAMTQRIMSAGYGGQILLSQTTADLTRDKLPAGVQLIDLRKRRLKDILQPVQLYQLSAPDLPSGFAPLAAPEVVNHNLPSQLTAFIGRETELAALNDLLSDSHNRLITILAPGGMGKTRLSLEAARQMVQVFPQGIYFIPLDRISSADLVVQSIAEVLPISLSSNEDPKFRVIEYLRDKAILLVMDNFEHVLDGASFVQEILSAAPRVQILATSRAKLKLTGEMVFTIDGLTIHGENPERNSAIQLFVQSARHARPEFELTAAGLPAVTHICRLVGGMPLAIVLAAAWIDVLSVDEIAGEIEKSIDMLETEKRDVPDRQRSVRAVIASSWNQIDETAQNLLKYLSVYRGGFTRMAAQEAAGASFRDLSQLVDKALLRRDPISGRYTIHEMLRQFAEEQLLRSADMEKAAHEAHASYFADMMKVYEMRLHDHGQKAALLDIEADFDNIRVAWNYWTQQQDAHRLIEFIGALWLFFEVKGSFTPAIQFFGDAVKKLTANKPEVISARAQLQARQGWFTALIGLPDEGLRLAQESVNTLSQLGEQEISVETLQCMNINAIFLNKNEIVTQVSEKMIARSARSADTWEQGWASVWWAYALVVQGKIGEALQTGQDAFGIFERLDNPFGASVASGIILGAISMAAGDIPAAKNHYLRGVQAAETIYYLRLLQISYDSLGTVALIENDIQQARQYFLKSLSISRECGQTREMLASLRDLASVQIAQGNLEEALILLAVVLNHPASDQNSLNRPEGLRGETEKLRVRIMARLEPDRYQSAWDIGQKQLLSKVVAQALA